MTPERWRQIEDLCHETLTRPLDERAAFLAVSCKDDSALLREVQSLLAQEAKARGFMSVPAAVPSLRHNSFPFVPFVVTK